MGWRDKVKSGCSWAANTWMGKKFLDFTATSLDYCGTVACMIGGVGLSSSFLLDVDIKGVYFAEADTTGEVTETFKFKHMPIEDTTVIPFSYLGAQKTGSAAYNLQDYLSASSLRANSAMMMTMGGVLRLASANIKLYRRGREDEIYYKESPHLYYEPVSSEDYILASLESFSRSLFFVCASSLMTTGVLCFFGLVNSTKHFNYPENGRLLPNTSYPDPLDSFPFPIYVGYGKNISGNIFHLSLDAQVTGSANISYGAMVDVTSNAGPQWPEFVGFGGGTLITYSGCSFFTQKIRGRQRAQTEKPIQAPASVQDLEPDPDLEKGEAPFKAFS